MKFLDKIEQLMKEKGIKNLNQLSDKTGIPYTTLRTWYDDDIDTENIRLCTLQKLKQYFKCTLDYLVVDEITDPYNFPNIEENEFDKEIKQLETDDIKIIMGKNKPLTKQGYLKITELLIDEIKNNNIEQ